MIEWRWGLAPLTVRDAHAINLARVLDFGAPNTASQTYTVAPFDPTTAGCATAAAESGVEAREWKPLIKLAKAHGWKVG
jgi:phospholipase C